MALAELHLPLLGWVIRGAAAGGGVVGVVTGGVSGMGVGTVAVGGGDGVGGTGTGPAGGGETRRRLGAVGVTAAAACAGRGSSSRVSMWGRATGGAGRTTAEEGPSTTGVGGVPGRSSPGGGGWRISKERVTDPATATAAGTNDPIPPIPSFIPSSAPRADSPPLDAHLSIGRAGPALERTGHDVARVAEQCIEPERRRRDRVAPQRLWPARRPRRIIEPPARTLREERS